jgi:predicted transcriptional regulator YdeE
MMEEGFTLEAPAIRKRKGFLAAGLYYVGKNCNGEVPRMWDQFIERVSELIPEKDWPFACYGLCRMTPGLEPGAFEYLASVEVPSLDGLPEGMVGWDVPDATYAAFKVPSLEKIHEAWGYVYGEGLAKLDGWEPDDKTCFEFYPVEFPEDPSLFIYAPVKQKQAG